MNVRGQHLALDQFVEARARAELAPMNMSKHSSARR